jgi:putative transposase
MKQKQHSTEDIIRILRQADTDQNVESVRRDHNISKATFHRWKRKYGDMDIADAKRLKELEKENAELKKMLTAIGAFAPCWLKRAGRLAVNKPNASGARKA